ncbi:unnamed protein product [Cylicocyclus nassatus]|uniref:SHSP domain-containing protein n=1 Tax=Cylicocyclus nassatus TaxID=53992 RepID=A0AA36GCN5_CYLNA|nr:unnamed protein product [Cylicocyclus nassatus]
MSRCFLPEVPVPDRGQSFRNDVEQALAPLREAVSRGNFDSAGNLVEVVNDEYKMAISMNVAQFTPDQLSVDVDGRVLTIEGKQENEESNGFL